MSERTAWIPGGAWDHIAELRREVPALANVEALEHRRRGRGWQVSVNATEGLARFLESEAGFWAGSEVDPESKWRVGPLATAAKRVREALS